MSEILEKIISTVLKAKTKDKLCCAIWKPFYDDKYGISKEQTVGLRILILNASCNGFGDLVFAIKLAQYLKDWYDADITIATTLEKQLLDLGADPEYVVGFTGKKDMQCRRFKGLKLNKEIPEQDLILVTPVQADFSPDLRDVKYLLPYANMFNTFYFSEYNDKLNKNFTFNTGIGKNRDGILLTDYEKSEEDLEDLPNPFVLIYVASSIEGVNKCILSFLEMIAKKYNKIHKVLDIVVPDWFSCESVKSLVKTISKYYPVIIEITKDEYETLDSKAITENDEGNVMRFRRDILPVRNDMMLRLMEKSLREVLLTGDQSITDAISCCYEKNIFYQIAPWKKDFAKNLAIEMPNVHLKSIKTSCGSLKAVNYKSNYKKFRQRWDFRNIAKPKLDAILASILAMKVENLLSDIATNSHKQLESIKKMIRAELGIDKPAKKSSRKSRKTPVRKSRKPAKKTPVRKSRRRTPAKKSRKRTPKKK